MAEHAMLTPRCPCGIDLHAHVVPEHLPAYAGRQLPALWPSMAAAPPAGGLCHRHVLVGAKQYRTVDERSWSTARRLADLPAMGLQHQVLSPMPELLSYWLEPADAQPLLRHLNETIAAMVAESAGAFYGLGAVPLQDIDLAITELRHAVQTLGLHGVEIGSNVNGVVIGDPRFDPFFEACAALGAAVFVHALKPAGMDRLVGPAPLQQVLAYPTDVGLAAASVITGNLLVRHPTLRIAFSHGGGTLSALLPRLAEGARIFPALREQLQQPVAEQARQLYFDTLVYDGATLRHLVASFGASQLMLGSDYPFNFHERAPAARVQACGFDDATTAALLHGNARRFLGLPKELNA
ncbi:MAG: amidohydrolase family protein [Rubrivivax sp.]|nr:amidohydrolase family protein [Rubrivivax sp.]MDP3085170.1 amidohydrolase family protein [Rubrivivax sp.]